MSFTDAPKVIGDPATHLVSAEVQQHYSDTCAIQCQRLILNQFGDGSTEESLVQEASARGIYHKGTSPEDVGKLLESHGIPVHRYENGNVFNLSNELAQGHKVIVGVESDDLWHKNSVLHEIADFFGLGKADHAVIVSGIDTTDPDHIKVNITDPGTGDVAKSYPIEQFMEAWKGSHFMMVSTAEPAPNTLAEMANFPYDQGHIAQVGHAPYDLVHDLSLSVDPNLPPEAFHAVESQYFSVMHGQPVDASYFSEVGPFGGQEHLAGLFGTHAEGATIHPSPDAYHGHSDEFDTFRQMHDWGRIGQDPFHHDHPHNGHSLDDPFHHGSGDDLFHHDV